MGENKTERERETLTITMKQGSDLEALSYHICDQLSLKTRQGYQSRDTREICIILGQQL